MAGWNGPDLITAVAVALGESGGNPRAFNPEGSYGLWQIYVPMHPEFANDDLYDPPTNASDAFQIYRKAGSTFQPWSAFKNGSYRRFLGVATAAAVQIGSVLNA